MEQAERRPLSGRWNRDAWNSPAPARRRRSRPRVVRSFTPDELEEVRIAWAATALSFEAFTQQIATRYHVGIVAVRATVGGFAPDPVPATGGFCNYPAAVKVNRALEALAALQQILHAANPEPHCTGSWYRCRHPRCVEVRELLCG